MVPPPDLDLPPRPVPRAPLTDVVPRRTLVIIAVVVVLAVIGAVLALTLGGDDKGSKGGRSAGRTSASAGASASASTKKDTSGGSATDGKTDSTAGTAGSGGSPATGAGSGGPGKDGSGDGSTSGGGSADGAATSTYRSGQGFSIGLPKGWKYATTDSAGVRFTGPDGQKLLVGWTSTPKDDPVADWKNQEGAMVRPQYQRIRIEKVDYNGWNTADWEFTYVDGGTKYRSIDRGFVVNGHQGYGLMYTAKAANWDAGLRKSTWQTLTKTFRPKS
ncbi:hypothetical protein ACH4UM_01440 [Streptomyces sp. NPDC020801]|uniref:hypothetical protein n=1 Tax=Streptomyces sp. NPDC020801 TaxID=3365093 RepID=UPI0037B68C9F